MRARVLVVEDERLLGEAICDLLGDEFDVELATTVAKASARLREDPSFEVILCDAQLPDGTALEIYEAYRAMWPERVQRFVFVSGGTDDGSLRALLTSGRHRVLTKPFDIDALPALVAEQVSLARFG